MEKTERETHDFMNVSSFSQLPFIRSPAPPPAAAAAKEKGIRLFGKEFGGGDHSAATVTAEDSQSAHTNPHEETTTNINNKDNSSSSIGGVESSRKFECHYCCRNFPTSQALGGHQNAHKRERQHAKRAHLQSAIMHGGLAAEAAHVYGLMNYHRLASVPTTVQPAASYHSWGGKTNSTSNYMTTNNSGRFYGLGGSHGSYNSHQTPINGSPLAVWRIPGAVAQPHGASTMHHQLMNPTQQVMSSNSQTRLGYETRPKMQEHVSLDLHL